MDKKPQIRADKTRFNITLTKKHKEHLEKEAEKAERLGMSLNTLFVMSALKEFPYKED